MAARGLTSVPPIIATGGAILIVMGVLILTGELTQLNIEAQKVLDTVGLDFLTGI